MPTSRCISNGVVVYLHTLECPMVLGREESCPLSYLMYIWMNCQGDLMVVTPAVLVGGMLVNHLMYADDLDTLSPSSVEL